MGATIRQIPFVPPAPVVRADHLDAFACQGIDWRRCRYDPKSNQSGREV